MSAAISKLLRDVFYNEKSPAYMAAASAVFAEARRRNKTVTRKIVDDYLAGEETSTLHKPVRKKFTRNRTVASGLHSDWQADLACLEKLQKFNDGNRFILTVIDVLSRFGWAVPIRTKKPEAVRDAFKTIVASSGAKCWRLFSDEGLEFYGRAMQKYLSDEQIAHYSPKNEVKCGLIERWNRTLKTRLWRLFTKQQSYRYIEQLPKIVASINNSINRATGCKPSSVTYSNAQQVWTRLYGPPPRAQAVRFKYPVGTKVRITKYKRMVFDKGYVPNWTREIFVVDEQVARDQPTYRLNDLNSKKIAGVFYENELLRVVQKDDVYKVEAVLRTRIKHGVKQAFVKWLGYDPSFNSWVKFSDIQNLK
jgi:hypothetical protein